MKLKKSFFNKTIFWKNVTLYWPIWVLYTAILVFFQPIMLWISMFNGKYYDVYTYSDKLGDLIGRIYMDMHVYLIGIVAVFIGMALFHYMYNHKSANMIHALPVDRTQLFGTNVISGILFLAVPQAISSVLLMIVALCNGIHEIHYVLYWLFMAIGIDIIAMAVVTFCAMFTGHLLALPVYAFIVNYFSYLVYYLRYIVIELFGFGLMQLDGNAQKWAALFSPMDGIARNVGLCMDYNEKGECTGALVFGLGVLAVYLLVAMVLYAIAYITYQKHHVEQAGEFVTVNWLKPVLRFMAAVTGGIFGAMMMQAFLHSVGIRCGLPMFVVLMLVIGALAYFVADMFIQKSFRVFQKKNWKGCAVSSVLLLGVFFSLYGLAKSYEDDQPVLAEIESASINMGYEITFTGDEIAQVLEIHDAILANKEICIKEEEKGNGEYEYLNLHYYLKDGTYFSRGYRIPIGYEETEAIIKKVFVLEEDVDNYLKYLFVEDYKEIELFNGGWFEAQFYNEAFSDREDFMDYFYDSISLTSEQAKELYEAVIADANAGTLMKYNIYRSEWIREGMKSEGRKYSDANILIEFKNPKESLDTKLWLEEHSFTYPGSVLIESIDSTNWYSAHVSFGPDCEHIVNKLIEFGFMDSVDDIWWGEIEE